MPGLGLAYWWAGSWYPYAACSTCDGSGDDFVIINNTNVEQADEPASDEPAPVEDESDEEPDAPSSSEQNDLRAAFERAKTQNQ